MSSSLGITLALAASAVFASSAQAEPPTSSGYHVVDRIAGPDGGWDYASYDAVRGRVLVARPASIDSFNPVARTATAALAPAARGHAAMVVNDGAEILITNGTTATVTFVDAATGSPVASVATGEGPDAVVFDPVSGLVLIMDHRGGDVVLIDPVSHQAVGRIEVGGTLEAAAVDGRGHAFVNIEDRNEIAVIDIAARQVSARYALTGCDGPTGIAFAADDDLLIAACDGVAEIVRASTGVVVRSIAIGDGADGVAYDPLRKLAFVPAGQSANLAVLRIADGDATLIDTVPTGAGARTIAIDPVTGKLFLPSAHFEPAVDGRRPLMTPGSFELLVIGT